MMAGFLPELDINGELAVSMRSVCTQPDAPSILEQEAISGALDVNQRLGRAWRPFQERVQELWRAHDHVIVRGIPAETADASLLLISSALAKCFRSYGGDKVITHFRMSPWTKELSHTLKEGHFHTDFNTSPEPPRVTSIQCKIPDPNAPQFGELRVARLPMLLDLLAQRRQTDLLRFLQEVDVTMVNDRSPGCWSGKIVEHGQIRFHPESIRAAHRRYPERFDSKLEDYLTAIHELALAATSPIHLGAADVLLVSNRRALHYRGACSVVFQKFPHIFTSREVHVLHMLDEYA